MPGAPPRQRHDATRVDRGSNHVRRGRQREPLPRAYPDPGVGNMATGLLIAGLGVLGHWVGVTTERVRNGVRQLGGHRHSKVDARRGRKS